MGQTESPCKSTVKMMYAISSDGSIISVFSDQTFADEYLTELLKVEPRTEHHIEDVVVGRPKGQEKAIFGSEACYDFYQGKVINFRARWLWVGDVTPLKEWPLGSRISRFQWLKFDTSNEAEFDKRCKPYKKLKFEKTEGDNCLIL